jgi:hypothetical protein
MSMNAPFNGPTVPTTEGADHLLALLAVIKDPATHKARLDELIAQEKAARDQIAALNEMSANTRRLNTAAQATNIISEKRKLALDAREAELAERASKIDQAEVRKSDAALRHRENLVQAREEAALRDEKRLAKAQADLESKHASIRGLADTLHN